MQWLAFSDGEFAKGKYGYYFVYKDFGQQTGIGHWSAEYKDASAQRDFNLSGLSNMEEAHQACENHADQQANESRVRR